MNESAAPEAAAPVENAAPEAAPAPEVKAAPPVQPAPAPQYQYQQASQPAEPAPPKGSRYAPVSTGAFFGVMLLMAIPVVNIILLVVWAVSKTNKISLRNYARAMLIWMIICVVASIAVAVVVGSLLAAAGIDWSALIGQIAEMQGIPTV